jgi:hypothetical protein
VSAEVEWSHGYVWDASEGLRPCETATVDGLGVWVLWSNDRKWQWWVTMPETLKPPSGYCEWITDAKAAAIAAVRGAK